MGRRSAVGTMSRAEGGRMGRTDLYHRRRTSGPAWALAARRARRICAFEYGPQKTKKTKNKKLTVETTTSTACTTHYTTTLLHYGSTHTQYTRYVILRDRLPRDSPRSDPCSSSSSCSCSLPRPVPRHGPWSGPFFYLLGHWLTVNRCGKHYMSTSSPSSPGQST